MMYEDGYPQSETNGKPLERVMRMIGVVSSFLIVIGLAYLAYSLGRRDATDVPVIAAIEGQVRTAPEEVGGTVIDHQGLDVNSVLEGQTDNNTGAISIAPEPTDLAGIEPAQPVIVENQNSSDPAAANESLPPVAPTIEEEFELVVVSEPAEIPAPLRRPELLYVPPKDQMNPLTIEAKPVAGMTQSEPVPSVTEISDMPDEIQVTETQTVSETTAAIAEDLPEIATPNATETEAVQDPLGPRLASGTPLIQLAANPDVEVIRSLWAKTQGENTDLLGGKSLYLETTDVNGTNYYRLRVQGFADRAESQAACAALVARGLQCIAVRAK